MLLMEFRCSILEVEVERNLIPAVSPESIADLNPDDIESISVLTGAAAAALYGSNAANGAIVITTKRGQVGKLQVSVNSNTEFSKPFVLPSVPESLWDR